MLAILATTNTATSTDGVAPALRPEDRQHLAHGDVPAVVAVPAGIVVPCVRQGRRKEHSHPVTLGRRKDAPSGKLGASFMQPGAAQSSALQVVLQEVKF